jgi:hypothetical protein
MRFLFASIVGASVILAFAMASPAEIRTVTDHNRSGDATSDFKFKSVPRRPGAMRPRRPGSPSWTAAETAMVATSIGSTTAIRREPGKLGSGRE